MEEVKVTIEVRRGPQGTDLKVSDFRVRQSEKELDESLKLLLRGGLKRKQIELEVVVGPEDKEEIVKKLHIPASFFFSPTKEPNVADLTENAIRMGMHAYFMELPWS